MGTDNAQRALMHLQAGLPLPDYIALWLIHGLQDYLTDGTPLAQALDLQAEAGGHYDRPHVALRLSRRDAEIRAIRAWTFPGLSAWQAAGEIAELMQSHGAGEPLGLPRGHPAEHLLARLENDVLSRRQILRVLNGDRSG